MLIDEEFADNSFCRIRFCQNRVEKYIPFGAPITIRKYQVTTVRRSKPISNFTTILFCFAEVLLLDCIGLIVPFSLDLKFELQSAMAYPMAMTAVDVSFTGRWRLVELKRFDIFLFFFSFPTEHWISSLLYIYMDLPLSSTTMTSADINISIESTVILEVLIKCH